MKLLMNLSDQLALARVRRRGHGGVQGFLAANQNDLLLGSGDSRIQEIAAQDFCALRRQHHNHGVILTALASMRCHRISENHIPADFTRQIFGLTFPGKCDGHVYKLVFLLEYRHLFLQSRRPR